MRTRLCESSSDRYRPVENSLLTKHVVAAGNFAKDAGSTPAASTIFRKALRARGFVLGPAKDSVHGMGHVGSETSWRAAAGPASERCRGGGLPAESECG